jgi:outer membrane protein OmpA-like peptidoglycan-associated protein
MQASNGSLHLQARPGLQTLRVESEGYHPVRQSVTVKAGEEVTLLVVMNPELVTLRADRIEINETIYFETASATIKPESFALLGQVADVLREHPELLRVRIEGHTDSRGRDDYNLRLSQERAASVREYLISQGIAPKRLESVGYGETRPLDPRENEQAWSQNRRVDFMILDKD